MGKFLDFLQKANEVVTEVNDSLVELENIVSGTENFPNVHGEHGEYKCHFEAVQTPKLFW